MMLQRKVVNVQSRYVGSFKVVVADFLCFGFPGFRIIECNKLFFYRCDEGPLTQVSLVPLGEGI